MKTIRSLMTLAGLTLALFALGATGARAQSLSATNFSGTFTLPFEAHWGAMTLPKGDYSLYYGQPFKGGTYAVEVRGTAKGSPHAFIFGQASDQASVKKTAIVCVRDGNTLVVRALEMPKLGKSVTFVMPYGGQLTAHQRNGSTNTQLAEAPMLIQRVPITLNGK
jgi:hypothetical protein